MRQRTLSALLFGCTLSSVLAAATTTTRVSTDGSGQQATAGSSFAADVDATGNLVVFSSGATNLVPADGNGLNDIFLKNQSSGAITLASRNTLGATATGTSNAPAISANGLVIAFNSAAADLVVGDLNARADIFVFNVAMSTVTRVSVATGGAEANGLSVGTPALSADGRFVAFESTATNLSALDNDAVTDIYRHDRQTGSTVLISQTTAGALGGGSLGSNRPSISADGRFVAFESSRVLVADDNNATGDIYLRDVQAGTTVRVNSSASGVFPSAGFSARPSISGSGQLIAFRSLANSLVPGDGTDTLRDIFIKNLQNGEIRRVTAPGGLDPNADSNELDLSSDGTVLIFHSLASNLISGDGNSQQDIFRLSLSSGLIERMSTSSADTEANDQSGFPRANANGSVAAYESAATNLVDADTNARLDVFTSVIALADAIFSNGFEL